MSEFWPADLQRIMAEPVGQATRGEWSASPYWDVIYDDHRWRVVSDDGTVVAEGMTRADAEFVAGAHRALKNTADEIVAWVEGLA